MIQDIFVREPEKWSPHKYQTKAMKFLLEHSCAALFLDPGLGKTSITLGAIKILKKKKLIKKVLLIAPLRVCYSVWPREIQKWEDFKDLKIEVLHGNNKDSALKKEADIYVINPEGLDWLLQVKKVKVVSQKTGKTKTKIEIDTKRFKALGFDTLVIDELTKFKNRASSRFEVLKSVHKTFGRRWGLTGSPASNGLLDLFGQCYILDEGRSLGQYITQYKSKYFEPVDHNRFVWVPRPGAAEQIYERVRPLALRMAAEDYLEMPQLIENNILLDLPDAIREIYDRLEQDLIAKIDGSVVVASNAAVASGKCRQVANGGLYLDPELKETGFAIAGGKRKWSNLHFEKVDALVDLIEELQGEPLLVAYDFEHDLDRLREKLGKDVPHIGGGVTPNRSKELERLWNSGQLPVLLGHPQSLAHGLNLQEVGRHVAWHSMTWDFELYDQFIRRVLRQGNKNKKVFVHHFMMRNTVDQIMYYSVKSKDRGQQTFFKGLQELARTRSTKLK